MSSENPGLWGKEVAAVEVKIKLFAFVLKEPRQNQVPNLPLSWWAGSWHDFRMRDADTIPMRCPVIAGGPIAVVANPTRRPTHPVAKPSWIGCLSRRTETGLEVYAWLDVGR